MKWITRAVLVLASGIFCAFAAPVVGSFFFAGLDDSTDTLGLARIVFIPVGLIGAIAGLLSGCILVTILEDPKRKKYLLAYAAATGLLLGFASAAVDYVMPGIQQPNFNLSFAVFSAMGGIVCALGSALFLRFLHANI